MLADTEDGNDVCVVQIGRGLSLSSKSLQLCRAHKSRCRQDLDRHVAFQRRLLGFVDDSHTAPANLAENAKIAQPLRRLRVHGGVIRPGRVSSAFHLLHGGNGRKQLADIFGQLGVVLRIVANGWMLAATQPLGKVLSQHLDGMTFRWWPGHDGSSCHEYRESSWTAPLCRGALGFSNPKRKRGNCRNVFPRLRFGLRWDATVALSH